MWNEADRLSPLTERDYAYLIQMGKYATFEACFKAVFPRTLYVSGIEDPDSFASKEDLDYIWSGYRNMDPRPGCAEMLKILREGGYTVWCLSNASVERVKGLWDNHGMDMPSGESTKDGFTRAQKVSKLKAIRREHLVR